MGNLDEAAPIAVNQLAGPGVAGMESDPPLYHFDVDPDQMTELMADPAGFLVRLGLGPEHGVAPGGAISAELANSGFEWTGSDWQPRETTESMNVKGCCFVDGDRIRCHVHR